MLPATSPATSALLTQSNVPVFQPKISSDLISKVGEIVTPTIVCPETEESVDLEIDLLSVEPTKDENHKNKIN